MTEKEVAMENFVKAHNLWLLQSSDLKDLLESEPLYHDVCELFDEFKTAYATLKVASSLVIDDQGNDVHKKMVAARTTNNAVRKLASKFISSNESSTGDKTPEAKVSNKSEVQFKKLQIPTWDGRLRTYLRFKSIFKRLVEGNMPEELALIRLKEESLRSNSRAELLIRAKPSLASAWDTLDIAFGRANMIRDSILHDVNLIPAVQDLADADGLRHLVTELLSAKEDLITCNRESSLNEMAFSVVMQKLPTQLRRQIDKSIVEDDLNTADAFNLILTSCESAAIAEEIHILRLEACSSAIPSSNFPMPSKSFQINSEQDNVRTGRGKGRIDDKRYGDVGQGNQSHQSDRKASKGKGSNPPKRNSYQNKTHGKPSGSSTASNDTCFLHPNADHETKGCQIFIGKSASEKMKLLTDNDRCKKCFRKHATENCKSKHACMEGNCKNPETHHTTIHSAYLTTMTAAADLLKQPKSEQEKQELRMFVGRQTVRPSHLAYLSTKTKGKKSLTPTKVLYDTGATLSQILNSVAKSVGLQPINTLKHLRMRTAGKEQSEDWGRADLYKVPLHDSTGALVITLNCIGVDYIGDHDSGSYEQVVSLFKDDGLKMNELLTPARGTIEILIGDNHAGCFPKPIKTVGDVIWAETFFGNILHGAHHDFFPHLNAEGVSLSEFAEDLISRSSASLMVTCSTVPRMRHVTVEARSGHICTSKIQEETSFDRMCKLDESPVCFNCGKCSEMEEEKRRLEIYRSCLRYDPDQKIFTCLMPWIENLQTVPDNRSAALKRLSSLTKTMDKNPALKEWYVSEFEKLQDEGFMTDVTDVEDQRWKANGGKVFYISHFAHLSESSSSTPLRVIFDASVPFKGVSINSLWEAPPNLIPPIPMLIVRFRERRIPIAMDISKAYLSVHLDTVESHLHRLLWNRLDYVEPVKTMRMLRNSWGMRPAGGMCSVAMLMIAEMYRSEYPEVYDFIRDNLYVDDGTTSVDDVSTALRLAHDTSHVLSQASFKVKHFIICGNNVDLSIASDADNLSGTVRHSDEHERVLGVLYHSEDDDISILARINFSKKMRGARSRPDVREEDFDVSFPDNFSLRMYLSTVASIYDPAGLASPVTILLKHELGRIFALKLEWDQPIPDVDDSDPNQQTTRTRCKELVRMIYDLCKVQFTRCLHPIQAVGDPILVIFCDSSQTAYACVSYYNWLLSDGVRESRLVMAKARPWPKSPLLTVPRGELMACVLGVRMKKSLLERTSHKFEKIVMITDSTIVLGQMRRSPSHYNTWTANRLDEVQRLSSISDWFHVESAQNVADDATRGLSPADIGKNSRWQRGPEFLTRPVETWPITAAETMLNCTSGEGHTDQRLKDPRMDPARLSDRFRQHSPAVYLVSPDVDAADTSSALSVLERLNIPDIDPNDRWIKAKRRIARILRFVENLGDLYRKVKTEKRFDVIPANISGAERSKWFCERDKFVPTKRELTIAGLYLVRRAQRSLPDDVQRKFASLNPEKDPDGVWRFTGRGKEVLEIPPIIIPRSHPLSTVLIRHYHGPQHSGSDATLALLRQEFWITDGPRAINAFVHRCAQCRRLRKRPVEVEIAPKKKEQLTRSPVFRHVTLDLAGPYLTVADRRTTRGYAVETGKVWILVLVCRASGAVHMELVEGYDTKSFLAGYDAFTRVRGKPETVTADLGSQIRGAANTLRSLWQHVDKSKLQADPETTEWFFIPSGSHSSLGQAERHIRTIKQVMEAVTWSKNPRLPKLQFQRLLYYIADLVNNRPIGTHRRRVGKLGQLELLRPNDLLLGRSSTNVSKLGGNLGSSEHADILAINEALVNEWWRKWYELIFHSLLPREKWLKSGRTLVTGDIVLIKDENPICDTWSWGEVDSVLKSSDNIVRSANVRYKDPSGRNRYTHKSVRDLVVIHEREEQ